MLTVCQEEYLGSSALTGLGVGGWMVVQGWVGGCARCLMWMCLEEGEEVVGGRREVFWAVVGVGLCDRRKGWRWMAGEEMMTFSFSVCLSC